MTYSFYNEDRKREFIKAYVDMSDKRKEARELNCLRLFNKLEKVEQKYGKDVCEFKDGEEINSVYTVFAGACDSFTIENMAILRKYLLWCYQNSYIGKMEYKSHPLKRRPTSTDAKTQIRSAVTLNKIDIISRDLYDFKDDFVFEDEKSLMEYLDTVFAEESYHMIAAMLVLGYYQFSEEEIVNMTRQDVNIATYTVKGVHIDTEEAFRIISRVLDADGYTVHTGEIDRYELYNNTPYLIRTTRAKAGDTKENEDGCVPHSYYTGWGRRLRKAMDELPASSPYKGIMIKKPTLVRMYKFHRIRPDEIKYGIEYVHNQMKAGAYGKLQMGKTDKSFREYLMMASRARII